MHTINIIIIEAIITNVLIITIGIDDMIQMDAVAAVVEMIVVVTYVYYIAVIHVVSVLGEICVLVSRS